MARKRLAGPQGATGPLARGLLPERRGSECAAEVGGMMRARAARIGAAIVLALGIGILCPPGLWATGRGGGADSADGYLTWALLAAGVLAAALGAGWVITAARGRARIERLVAASTRERVRDEQAASPRGDRARGRPGLPGRTSLPAPGGDRREPHAHLHQGPRRDLDPGQPDHGRYLRIDRAGDSRHVPPGDGPASRASPGRGRVLPRGQPARDR